MVNASQAAHWKPSEDDIRQAVEMIEQAVDHKITFTDYRVTLMLAAMRHGAALARINSTPTASATPANGDRLREAFDAADYLIDLYKRLWRGGVVRDLDEAIGAYENTKRTALSATEERVG